VLPSLDHFDKYLRANACRTDLKARIACENEAEFATYAASVDIDFDAISHTVDLSALWTADKNALSQRPGSGITDRAVVKYRENHRVEIGVLQNEPVKEVEELSLGGYLAVLGEHEKPSMFNPQPRSDCAREANTPLPIQAQPCSPSPPATTLSLPPPQPQSYPLPQPSSTQRAFTPN